MHVREHIIGLGRIPVIILFSIPRGSLHIPSLVGRNIRLIAQRLYLPHRESHSRQKIYRIGTDEGGITCSFPNPIPSGTRVPQWALIDVTVRCNVYFYDIVFTTSSSLRTLGTRTGLLQSAVRILFLSFYHDRCLKPTSCYLDSPEQTPGTRLGTQKSGSNTGIIVGSAVGGVAVISLVIVIVFFLRRRRRGAPAPVASGIAGVSQQPLTMGDGYTASSISMTDTSSPMPGTPMAPMRNVRVSCPISRRASVCSLLAVSCPFIF